MKRLTTVLVWLVLAANFDAAQLVIVRGRVVAQDDAAFAMRGARVELLGGSATADPVFTDAEGRFVLGVPTSFTLKITKAGYAPAVLSSRASADELEARLTRGAVMTGRVADALGFPVVNALVRARWLNAPGGVRGLVTDLTVETDDNGEFRIGNLAAGRYSLNTERRPPMMDYMDALMALPREVVLERERARRELTQSKPLSDPVTIEVAASQETFVPILHHERAVVPSDAPIGGAVTGTVVNEFGEPIDNVTVRLWRLRYAAGRQLAEPTPHARRVTDRGQYRLFHVLPARYLVVVTSDDSRQVPVYYPGVTAIGSASPVVVARRQEVPGVHVAFTPTRHSRLLGTVRGAAGEALDATISLIATGAIASPPIRVAADAAGLFEFRDVVPGEYVVQAYRGRSDEIGVRRIVVADGEDAAVTMTIAPTATLTGRVVADDGRPLPPGLRLTGMLEPEYTPNVPRAVGNVNADGRFEMRGLIGPVRFALTSGMRGYRLEAVEIAGVNAAEERVFFEGARDSRDGVVVTLSSDVAAVSGRVRDDKGEEPNDYRVVIFSMNPERWFAASPYLQITAGPNPDGRFVIQDVPPGDYWAAAVDVVEGDLLSGEWQSAEFLGALGSQAIRLTLGARQEATLDLRLIRRGR